MARVQNPIIGRASGKFGTGVFATLFGQNILRSLPVEVRNPRTPAQIAQREKFAAGVAFIKKIYPFIKQAFPSSLANMVPASYVLPSVLRHAGAEAGLTKSDTKKALDDFNPVHYGDFGIGREAGEVEVDIDLSALDPEMAEGDEVLMCIYNVTTGAVSQSIQLVNSTLSVSITISLPGTSNTDDIVVFFQAKNPARFKAGASLGVASV